MSMEYLKTKPITVIGGGAVGKTIAVDCKLGVGDSQEVRLFDAMPFAAQTLKNLEKTGLNLVGPQTNRDGFYRGGKAYIQAGAGIVADSDPEKEFEETTHKAGAMLNALKEARK